MGKVTNKKTLEEITQELFPGETLMTANECINYLNWTTEFPEGDERGTGKITCDCGTQVKTGGWIGTEHVWCPNCHKGMQDVTGILPVGNSTATLINIDQVELPSDGRFWIPKNVWGF